MLEETKENSLKTAGYAYLVGDAALFASGMMSGRHKEAASGLVYTVGGLACAKYGNPDAQAQLKLLSQKLGAYLRKQNVGIPNAPETALLAKPGSAIDRVEEFLYTYPSQLLNATYAFGGVQLLRSGLQHKKGWDAASGALVAAGGLAGLLLPESIENTSGEKPKNIVEWCKEKPLRVSGGLYALNNVTLTMSALKERRENPAQKSYLFKFLTAGSYLFGNTMLSLSSKDNVGSTKDGKTREALEKLTESAAHVIAAQHPALQESLVTQISVFLSSQPSVKMEADHIDAILRAKLASVRAPATENMPETPLPRVAPHTLATSHALAPGNAYVH